jgi:hypothetical protein
MIFVGPCIVTSLNKNNQRDAACSLCLYFLLSTLHVSGAFCTHHQEYLKTVHADFGTIVY